LAGAAIVRLLPKMIKIAASLVIWQFPLSRADPDYAHNTGFPGIRGASAKNARWIPDN
jgi:hypothetical protein